jgi:hypothetical protein
MERWVKFMTLLASIISFIAPTLTVLLVLFIACLLTSARSPNILKFDFFTIGSTVKFGQDVQIQSNYGTFYNNYDFLHRQVLRISAVNICKCDPLMIFRLYKDAKISANLYCLPEVVPVTGEDIRVFAKRFSQVSDYNGFREYKNGDDIRLINWNQYASSGELTIKDINTSFSDIELRIATQKGINSEENISKFYSIGLRFFKLGNKQIMVNNRLMNYEDFAKFCASI